jgi:hypothetical protein
LRAADRRSQFADQQVAPRLEDGERDASLDTVGKCFLTRS